MQLEVKEPFFRWIRVTQAQGMKVNNASSTSSCLMTCTNHPLGIIWCCLCHTAHQFLLCLSHKTCMHIRKKQLKTFLTFYIPKLTNITKQNLFTLTKHLRLYKKQPVDRLKSQHDNHNGSYSLLISV